MASVSDEAIISALLTYGTNKQVASALNMSESNLYKRMASTEFKRKYNKAKSQIVSQTTALLQKATAEAVSVIVNTLTDKKASAQTKINAGDILLRNSLRYTEQNDILQRLDELEREEE